MRNDGLVSVYDMGQHCISIDDDYSYLTYFSLICAAKAFVLILDKHKRLDHTCCYNFTQIKDTTAY